MAATTESTESRGAVLGTWVSPDLEAKARTRAAREDRSVSYLLRRALSEYLKDERHPAEGGAVKDRLVGAEHGPS
jgi:hypothetical protein